MKNFILFKVLVVFVLFSYTTYAQDSDGDGVPDSVDIDDDNDGIIDTYECSATIQFNNASLLTATDLDDVKAGEKVIYSNALLYQNQYYDIVLTIITINGSFTVDCNNELRVDGFDSSTDEYITYSFDLVEAGTATPSNPIGIPAILYGMVLESRDIDTRSGDDFTEIAGFNPSTATSSVTGYLNATTNLEQAGFINGGGPTGYTTYRLDPTIAGSTTDWEDEPHDGGTQGNDPDFYLYMEFDIFSHVDLLYGATGTVTTSTRLTNFGVSSKCDFDNDNILDTVDIDSDNDGIPDNVEAQPTLGYIPPSNVSSSITDANGNGLDDVYESAMGGTDLNNLEDTDGDKLKDYLDSDTDNDGTPDIQENGQANILSGLDVDNDGLDDVFDVVFAYLDINDEVSVGDITDLTNSFEDVDSDATIGGDLDYRDLFDINPPVIASIDFDGVDDYLSRASFINGLNDVTIMAWIKSDAGNSTNMVIAGEDTGCKLWLENGNTPKFTIKSAGNSETTVSCSSINFDEWHHITGTYKSSTGLISLYLDGALLSSTNVTNTGAAIENTEDSNESFEVGRLSTDVSNKEYFKGNIDEVRVFNTALIPDQIQQMVYQEIENNSGNIRGSIIPKNIGDISGCSTILWNNLIAYYPMTNIKKGTTSDYSGYDKELYLNYITTIQEQTAPMPYKTSNNGAWSTEGTWQYGNVWDIENISSNKDWCIVAIKNDVNTSNSHSTLGLLIDSGSTLTINNDKELNNSWYLKLDGKIDLQGESQLIQGADSSLDVTSTGTLERDQQGTKDLYTYNYWSSPVGLSNTTSNNNSYTLNDILNDGSVATNPLPINFVTGYNGSPGSPGTTPVGIASYWVWKYANKLTDNYASWQHVRNTGTVLAGEGYTMKGVDNSPTSFTEEQNYVFNGKPNNGDIKLTLSAGNDYLVGNPYASAIDANEFILDNISAGAGRAATNIIDGTLYFWDHFAGNTHILREYQGGYATYTLMGGIKAVSTDTRINASGQIGTKVPQQYIPVSQGFFVTADAGGIVTFKNSQRTFKTEASDPSLFLKGSNTKGKSSAAKTNSDDRQKIRLMFDSPKGYHRQLLVGEDTYATSDIDKGYDAPLIENNVEDLFWIFNNKNFVIQAVNNFDDTQILPLGIKIDKEGLATIKIDELENIDSNKAIYLHDKELNVYHDLKESEYDVHLATGEYLNRFELTFSKASQSLSTDETNKNPIEVYFSNEDMNVVVHNPNSQLIESVEMINILGQSLFKFEINSNDDYLRYKASQMKTGTYILKIETEYGKLSKKVLIN
ncbi:LamG-like jellyroll fold domain-containing protein [uncultured Wocania sp.]|uniref:LamG-like jellyroll fold domain-containing protein n=1 Tax=uncultured Wocania sp. TaxID=2834404 RepID=UPI0030F89865